jgi:hypothetical protein
MFVQDSKSDSEFFQREKAKKNRKRLLANTRSLIISILSLSVALGFNRFIDSVQITYPSTKTPLGAALFFMFMFIFSLACMIMLDTELQK